jgi:hypothetical protein
MNWKEWFRSIKTSGVDTGLNFQGEATSVEEDRYQAFKARLHHEQSTTPAEGYHDVDEFYREPLDQHELPKFTFADMLSFGRDCTYNAMTTVGRKDSVIELLKEWREKNKK